MKWEISKKKYDDIILQVLYNRGIVGDDWDKKTVDKFLNPNFDSDFYDPKLLPDYQKVEDKIVEAKEKNLKIGIFADYDADGIPGAALLYKCLTKLKIKSDIYIPNRESGYGLSCDGIDYLISEKCAIIITVDLGIRSFEEAKYANSKSVCLLITDHHEPDKKLPASYSVTNPKIKGSKYPFSELSGAGVIFKIIQGLSAKYPKELSESFIKWNIDLAAISTISDVVPLAGENRIIAKFGLRVLRKTKNLGIRALCEAAEIDISKIDVYSVGFLIGPRINAPGRIDHATKSFRLLTSVDKNEVNMLAHNLNQVNEKRQGEMKKLELEARKIIEKDELDKNKGIVILGDWHKGVLGPSASHIAEKYFRPTIVFSDRDDLYVGSARSISGIDLIQLLSKCEGEIERFGGHKGAAGLAVRKSHFKSFVKKFIEVCNKLDESLFEKKMLIDAVLQERNVTLGLINRLSDLEPFGMGNRRPVFMLEEVKVADIRSVGKESSHLSFKVILSGKKVKAIYFNASDKLSENTKYDMIFSLDEDFWNGNHSVQLKIIEIRKHGEEK